jgi:Lon protease-like protein
VATWPGVADEGRRLNVGQPCHPSFFLDGHMDGDYDLRDFANVCRLFPLPKVVLFPHAVLPLHIFEPRYRQMTEDALAGDQLVTIVQWRAPFPIKPGLEPPLEEIACLGRILQHERLPDGRFHFLLLGRKRVRLVREIPGDKLYRLAVAEILEDENTELPQEPRRSEIAVLFRRVSERHGSLDPDLKSLIDTGLPLGSLTDLVAHALGLPPAIKQELLAETRVDRRADVLLEILRGLVDHKSAAGQGLRPFPPPFSTN